jgi:DNA-binding NarL/FixJ family response regulator
MQKIILADNQAVFRAGTARILAMEDDLRNISQCADPPALYRAITHFPGAIAIVAASMCADWAHVIAGIRSAESRIILIAENGDLPSPAVQDELQGLMYRDVSVAALLETVRTVIRGERSIQPVQASDGGDSEAPVGARVRDRLTPREMKIVALVAQGCKHKEIGLLLGTSEQVVKNYLSSIYDKTGVSDRLELALFIMHHRALAEAATSVRNLMGSSA